LKQTEPIVDFYEFPGEYHGFENWHKRGDLTPPQLRHMTTVPGQG
jgi:hypothetical protein